MNVICSCLTRIKSGLSYRTRVHSGGFSLECDLFLSDLSLSQVYHTEPGYILEGSALNVICSCLTWIKSGLFWRVLECDLFLVTWIKSGLSYRTRVHSGGFSLECDLFLSDLH